MLYTPIKRILYKSKLIDGATKILIKELSNKQIEKNCMKILIIIPAYNESLNIERVVDNIISNYPQYDYVVVNDGSKDETAEICRQHKYNLIDLSINLGLTGAFQAGIKYAFRHGYDAAIQLDGDGQHDPKYIDEMVKCMVTEKADIIIGSRFINGPKNHSMRMIGADILTAMINLTTGTLIKDPTSGMRLFSRKVLKEFANNMNYSPEPDTISYLIKNGSIIKEVPVVMDERTAGESYLNFKQSVKYMSLMCLSIIFIQQFRRRKQ